jgi:hypothetical protein
MSIESGDSSPDEVEGQGEIAPEAPALGTQSSRRTFLKGAALGTAAAAMYSGSQAVLRPVSAYANDLSTFPCTAQDVEIIGPGTVTNEPCTCPPGGTFTATVQFTVRNNTSAGRYCIAIHLNNGTDILLVDPVTGTSTAKPQSDTVMRGQILNYPCGAGRVCFGDPLPESFTGKCEPGHCSTVAWSTSVNQANCSAVDTRPPGGQCRHQQICIQGFGIKAECADASCATRPLTSAGCCSVDCGAALRVKITATGQSGDPCSTPLTIRVKRPGETTFTDATLTNGCYVDPSPVQGPYIFRARDCHGCFRETTLEVCVTQFTVDLNVSGNVGCTRGNLTFTASVPGRTGCTFVWMVDGTVVQGRTGPTLNYTANPDTLCHRVSVRANCGGCLSTNTASITVSQCVQTTTGCTAP